jgi:hypothetical protein
LAPLEACVTTAWLHEMRDFCVPPGGPLRPEGDGGEPARGGRGEGVDTRLFTYVKFGELEVALSFFFCDP